MTAPEGLLGFPGLTLIASRKGWKRDIGQTKIEVFKGPVDSIDSRFDILTATPNVDNLDRDIGDGFGILTVTTVEDELTSTFDQNDVWECIGQELLKPIRAHQDFNKEVNQDKLEDTRKFYLEGFSGPGPHDGDGDPFKKYLEILRRENTEFIRSAAVLRRSLTVGPRSTQFASWDNVDRAITIGATGLPSSGQPLILGSIQSMPEANNAKKQWLKRGPQIRTSGDRRFTITQEFWFARRWSETFYEGDAEDGNP